MTFRLEERPPGWAQHAPIQIADEVFLPAPPEDVFALLADLPGWTRWFRGMRRVRIDGPASGVGALRTVWVGPTRAQERFIAWDPPHQITLQVVASSSPGLRVMAEEYQVTAAAGGSKLLITVGLEARWPWRLVPGLVRFIVGRLSRGALGITSAFS